MSAPKIDWIKNDPHKFQYFYDDSVFLVAIRVAREGELPRWDFDVVRFQQDDAERCLVYRGYDGEQYDSWSWDDFEYFTLLEGKMPTNREVTE